MLDEHGHWENNKYNKYNASDNPKNAKNNENEMGAGADMASWKNVNVYKYKTSDIKKPKANIKTTWALKKTWPLGMK